MESSTGRKNEGKKYEQKVKARVFERKQEHVGKIKTKREYKDCSDGSQKCEQKCSLKILTLKNTIFFKFDFGKRKKETR
jgi:hypothetical protein